MKTEFLWLVFGGVGLVGCMSAAALAYDRDKAVDYALEYSARAGTPPQNVVNSTVYYDYSATGGNCANFGSQCLIAGGFRFRASSPPNNTAPAGKGK